jgi:hypothetical protein
VPIRVLAIQKIVAGAIQSFIGAVIVFPIVLFVHAAGQAPHVHVTNWALLIVILAFASLLTSSLGLLLGTIMDPRKMQMLFAVVLLPATMLGCVYYPWSALHHIRWLQILVLINPMVYMSEGLRAVLTPVLGHMPMWGVLLALIGGTAVFSYLGTRTFTNRVLNSHPVGLVPTEAGGSGQKSQRRYVRNARAPRGLAGTAHSRKGILRGGAVVVVAPRSASFAGLSRVRRSSLLHRGTPGASTYRRRKRRRRETDPRRSHQRRSTY